MFRASSAHLQEVNDVNCTCMQPLVFSFSAGGRLVHLLRGDKLVIKLVSIKECKSKLHHFSEMSQCIQKLFLLLKTVQLS